MHKQTGKNTMHLAAYRMGDKGIKCGRIDIQTNTCHASRISIPGCFSFVGILEWATLFPGILGSQE